MILFTSHWHNTAYEQNLKDGASALRDMISELCPDKDIFCTDDGRQPETHEEHLELFEAVSGLIHEQSPEKILHIGGGCALDVPVLEYLKKRYPDIVVLWFDAHPDLHTTKTSVSGYIHGMAAGLITSDENHTQKEIMPLSDIIFCFIKEMDGAEADRLSGGTTEVLYDAASIYEKLSGYEEPRPVYIHIDFDVFQPDSISNVKCTENNGISSNAMAEFIKNIAEKYDLKGLGLLENTEVKNEKLEMIAETAAGIFKEV